MFLMKFPHFSAGTQSSSRVSSLIGWFLRQSRLPTTTTSQHVARALGLEVALEGHSTTCPGWKETAREKQWWGTRNQHPFFFIISFLHDAEPWLVLAPLTLALNWRERRLLQWHLGKMKFAQFLLKNGSVAGIPKQVERFSKFSPSPLSMKQFIDFGKCLCREVLISLNHLHVYLSLSHPLVAVA